MPLSLYLLADAGDLNKFTMDDLKSFVKFAVSKGYQATLNDNVIDVLNVKNPGNNFKIMKSNGYYEVFTVQSSRQDYEYLAKCLVYVLIAEYNKAHSTDHQHMDFKVQL